MHTNEPPLLQWHGIFSAPPNITKQAGLQHIQIQDPSTKLEWYHWQKNNWNLATILNFQDLQLQVSEENKKNMDVACSSHIFHRPPQWEEKLSHLEGRLWASPFDCNFVSHWMFNVTCDCISPNEIETYCKFQSITLTHHDLFEDKTPENRTNFTASAIPPVHVLVLPQGTHISIYRFIPISETYKPTYRDKTPYSNSTYQYQLVTNYHDPPRWIPANRSKRPLFCGGLESIWDWCSLRNLSFKGKENWKEGKMMSLQKRICDMSISCLLSWII